MEAGFPEIGALGRRCASEPSVLEVLPQDVTWDYPHRLLAAVKFLTLTGKVEPYWDAKDPWEAFRAIVAEHRGWVSGFVREHGIQSNLVQRCFVLLPIFLTVARMSHKPFDLIELGASAGLNLLFDRYRYRYRRGTWGPEGADLELTGEEQPSVPRDLLRQGVVVARRRGIDLDPIDASSETGMRLLQSFFLRDDPEKLEVLRRAAEVTRRDPPEMIRGDYVDVLPELLLDRDEEALTVVLQTHSTIYLPHDRLTTWLRVIERAGQQGPLVWISMPTPAEHGKRVGDYPLELRVWPQDERRLVARTNASGDQLVWLE